jgi:hypothetical protein
MKSAPMERSPDLNKHQEEKISEHQYQILDSPEIRVEYIKLTDELIYKLVTQETDAAIFLDKSARPVAWLVKVLWPILAPVNPKTGEQFKLPDIHFLNIDREQWGAILGRSEDSEGGIDIKRLPSERLKELRQIFAPVISFSKESDKSLFTDKKVMVIDELRQSGDTLDMAKKILEQAFPDAAEIKGAYWMYGRVKRDPVSGAMVGTEAPVWYSDTEITGRLVANRDVRKSLESNSLRQRIGRYWLSTNFRRPDLKGRQLKQEVKWLSEDLRAHRLIYAPSLLWDSLDSPESIAERIRRINKIEVDDFIRLKRVSPAASMLVKKYVQQMNERSV